VDEQDSKIKTDGQKRHMPEKHGKLIIKRIISRKAVMCSWSSLGLHLVSTFRIREV